MASNTRLRDRIFAGFGAVLFLASAVAVSAYYVATSHGDNSNANPQASQQNACTDTQTEPTFAAPEAYKPEGTVSELQATDIQAGNGQAAKDGDCLVMKYYGTLATTGVKFDENYTDASAFAFKLGQGQVIEGWDKGLVGMKVGGTRRLVIPAAQAYGSQSPSAAIPANSDLVFEVKLLRIQK
jgi:peptidylprolyl isomerase